MVYHQCSFCYGEFRNEKKKGKNDKNWNIERKRTIHMRNKKKKTDRTQKEIDRTNMCCSIFFLNKQERRKTIERRTQWNEKRTIKRREKEEDTAPTKQLYENENER